MRLCKPFFGTWRIVIADSWFASVHTLVKLRERGLYFIGNVKTGSRNFPKAYLLERAVRRHDKLHMRKVAELEDRSRIPIYASMHMDVQPMNLVHSCLGSNMGEESVRNWNKLTGGQMMRKRYKLQ